VQQHQQLEEGEKEFKAACVGKMGLRWRLQKGKPMQRLQHAHAIWMCLAIPAAAAAALPTPV
jgi:hypothetical protein